MELTSLAINRGMEELGVTSLQALSEKCGYSPSAVRSACRLEDPKWNYMRWTLIERFIGGVEITYTVKVDGKPVRVLIDKTALKPR